MHMHATQTHTQQGAETTVTSRLLVHVKTSSGKHTNHAPDFKLLHSSTLAAYVSPASLNRHLPYTYAKTFAPLPLLAPLCVFTQAAYIYWVKAEHDRLCSAQALRIAELLQ
jgi:hypothetical protein